MAASVLLAKKFDDNMDPTGWWMSEKLVNSINLTINGLLMLMLNEINICYVYVYIYIFFRMEFVHIGMEIHFILALGTSSWLPLFLPKIYRKLL